MKYKFSIISSVAIIAIMLFGTGCKKDYLEADVDQYLTQERLEELLKTNPAAAARLVESSLSGIYNVLIDYSLNGNTSHDFFGLKSVHLSSDLTSEDMVQAVHHQFGFDYNMENREAGFRRTRLSWQMFYKIISSANLTLDQFFKEEPADEGLKALKAKALGLRGIAYYYLVNLYQKTYKGNESALGVPLVLTPLDEKMPRAKVSEVYAQILEDLEYSVENGVNSADKGDVDKRVAAAFLAKTYATMEQWPKAEELAKIATEGVTMLDGDALLNGMGDISSPEWLWGFDINAQTSTLFASFYAHADNTVDGYSGPFGIFKNIHNKLYDKIPMDDKRKQQFSNLQLFPERSAKWEWITQNYISLKYQTPMDFSGDYCFLRAEDPYLLLVEALVEQNKLVEARNLLNSFIRTRQPSYNADAFSSQAALREEVRFQRRIELWGEGTAFFDFKRWNLGVTRAQPGTNHRTILNFPAGDKVFTYQIPQAEVDANPNLGGQNP